MPRRSDLRLSPLIAILDADVAARAGWTLVDLAKAYLNGGATLLQVRAKHASAAVFFDLAAEITGLAHAVGARVVVNDRADIARLTGADGVHVGQDDLSATSVRALVGRNVMVGLSTHTAAQVIAACEAPVSYVAIGPVFTTETKVTGYEPIGLDRVRAASVEARRCGLPLVAIGGITLETGASVLQAGAASVAVIGDLLSTNDPEQRVRDFLARLPIPDP